MRSDFFFNTAHPQNPAVVLLSADHEQDWQFYQVDLCMVITYSKGKYQPGFKFFANPARHFLCPRSRLRICSRETGPAVSSRISLLITILRLNMVLTYGVPPAFRCGVHLLI